MNCSKKSCIKNPLNVNFERGFEYASRQILCDFDGGYCQRNHEGGTVRPGPRDMNGFFVSRRWFWMIERDLRNFDITSFDAASR